MKNLIRSLWLVGLVFMLWGTDSLAAAAIPQVCQKWFNDSGIDPKSDNCEVQCAAEETDMGTFYCNQNCQELCKGDPCRNPEGHCDFYASCVEKKYQCGSSGYPIGYGQKYCERFSSLGSSELSQAGLERRDTTLLCLQQALSDLLYSSNSINSCVDLTTFAFESHVACYTSSEHSICDLKLNDLKTIISTVDIGDAFGKKGLAQMIGVLKICKNEYLQELGVLKQMGQGEFYNVPNNIYRQLTDTQIQKRIETLNEKINYIDSLD